MFKKINSTFLKKIAKNGIILSFLGFAFFVTFISRTGVLIPLQNFMCKDQSSSLFNAVTPAKNLQAVPQVKTTQKTTRKTNSFVNFTITPLNNIIKNNIFYPSKFFVYPSKNKFLSGIVKYEKNRKYYDAETELHLFVKQHPQCDICKLHQLYNNIQTKKWNNVFNLSRFLRKKFPNLKNYLLYIQAKAYFYKNDFQNALILCGILKSTPYKYKVFELESKIYTVLNKPYKHLESLKKYLNAPISSSEKAEKLLELAQLYFSLKKKKQAAKTLLSVWSIKPVSSYSVKAEKTAVKWFHKKTSKMAKCSDKILRAENLQKLNFHKKTVNLLKKHGCRSNADKCKIKYLTGRSLYNLKKRSKAYRTLLSAIYYCDKTKLLQLRVKSKYLAAKSAYAIKKYKAASRLFARIYKEHPDSSYADDALFLAALTYKKRKIMWKFHTLINTIKHKYPKGDMLFEALWQKILNDLKKRKWLKASSKLKKLRSLVLPSPPYSRWGRVLYWQGRVYEKMNMKAKAVKLYKETTATAPVTYYSLLALHGLDRLQPGSGSIFLKKIINKTPPKVAPWLKLKSDSFKTSSFKAFADFMRTGLPEQAKFELAAIGKSHPGKNPADKDFWRAVSYIYYLSGNKHKAMLIADKAFGDYRMHWIGGNGNSAWDIAYPVLYENIFNKVSKESGVEKSLMLGLVREESHFIKNIKSHAGAIGLGQLMPGTAKRFARKSGIKNFKTSMLTIPAVNLAITAAYLKFLNRKFSNKKIYVITSYNAGENYISRFKRKYSKFAIDFQVEFLSIKETRNYVKRVLSSVFAYHLLTGLKKYPEIM